MIHTFVLATDNTTAAEDRPMAGDEAASVLRQLESDYVTLMRQNDEQSQTIERQKVELTSLARDLTFAGEPNKPLREKIAQLEGELADRDRRIRAARAQESQRIKIENYLDNLDKQVDRAEAHAEVEVSTGQEQADLLFSRFQAATRARVARRIVKHLRALLSEQSNANTADGGYQYFKVGNQFFRTDHAYARPMFWSHVRQEWVYSCRASIEQVSRDKNTPALSVLADALPEGAR